MGDGWNAGSAYEDFMGRWTRPLAERFIEWMGPPPGEHWLDVGTGTGAFAAAICRLAQPTSVVACDSSGAFIEAARSRLADPRVRFEVAASGALPSRDGGFGVVVSGLALNFFPDPASAVEEQLSLLREGGWIGACVWDYAEGMEFLRYFWDAALAIDPRAAELDERVRFPICDPTSLESLFEACGAQHIRVGSISVPTTFASFDDYWRPFLGGAGPAPSFVATLSASQRRDLRSALEDRLASREDRGLQLAARAWAVVAQRT